MACYELRCTLCKEGFPSKREWLKHLVHPSHQQLTPEQGHRRWKEVEVRKEWLVVFTIPEERTRLTHLQVLQHFSDLGGVKWGPVTDFEWRVECPRMLLLQFESRSRVDNVLSLVGTTRRGEIRGEPFQVRRLSEYLPFECQIFFPWLELEPLKCESVPPDDSPIPTVNSSSSSDVAHSLLVRDFSHIYQEMEIPEAQFTNAINLVEKLQKVLSSHLKGCQLYLFRHWYLRLRSPPPATQQLLIFVRHDTLLQSVKTVEFYEDILLENKKLVKSLGTIQRGSSEQNDEPHAHNFLHVESGLRFSLVDSGFLLMELQTCQLVHHFCQTDARVKALLTLVLYWAQVNQVTLQDQVVTRKEHASFAPAPSAWEWLVIYFLTVKRILPVVKSVTNMLFDRDIFSCLVNPGFPMQPHNGDHSPVKKTHEDLSFVREVVKLAKEFFQHFGELQLWRGYGIVLNLRDGRFISVRKGNRDDLEFQRKGHGLGDYEESVLKKESVTQAIRQEFERQRGVKVRCPIYLLHPLHHNHGFQLDNQDLRNVWWKMYVTGKSLGKFLHKLNNKKNPRLAEALRLKETDTEDQYKVPYTRRGGRKRKQSNN